MSAIEKRIKNKIERYGTPLKDWDISINYGIKTGFNEAFIISGEKRQELIDQDPKSEDIIRPILRGRDIKRYTFDFASLYIIATFPSLKINIDLYPAVKQHLMSFGHDRLKQTGDSMARKKTNNRWFETQDSISYWEDFYKQKIVWKRVGSILKFAYDEKGMMALDSTCFATGKHLKYLVSVLNSKLGKYLLRNAPQTGTGDLLVSVQAIEPLNIVIPSSAHLRVVNSLVEKMLMEPENLEVENQILDTIFDIFSFDSAERDFIKSKDLKPFQKIY